MTALKFLVLLPLSVLVVADTPAPASPTQSPSASPAATATPSSIPTPTPTPVPTPTPTPSPSPIPSGAFLTLDVSAGPASSTITVSGNAFLANEPISIYWDTTTKVIGSTTADGNGNFTGVKVQPFAGDPPGQHKICASVAPQPCAQFALQAAPPSPSPSAPAGASPSPSESASPAESPTPSVIAVPVDSSNSLDVLTKPPFVFLPIVAILGLLAALAYWLMSANSANKPGLPSTSIVHRSVRPAYGSPGPEAAAIAPPEPVAPPADEPPAPPPAPPPPPEDLPPPPLPPQLAGPEPPSEPSEPPLDEQPPWPKL